MRRAPAYVMGEEISARNLVRSTLESSRYWKKLALTLCAQKGDSCIAAKI
jgi:hypothetical protein